MQRFRFNYSMLLESKLLSRLNIRTKTILYMVWLLKHSDTGSIGMVIARICLESLSSSGWHKVHRLTHWVTIPLAVRTSHCYAWSYIVKVAILKKAISKYANFNYLVAE